ncbi:beta-taxilin [Cyclopterus lumpus]|uniref:beta-taxilin n=1 Tax=Cyclopterus lumpus TaxID=8103 RepID=UPI001485D75D|nr:beta-taxilin [Cyclopterus lumpus]
METSVTAAEVPTPPRPDGAAKTPEGEEAAPPSPSSSSSSYSYSSSSSSSDPMEAFKRRLEDIISTHGSAADLLDVQVSPTETEAGKVKREPMEDIPVAIETEVCLVMNSLKKLSSPEKKLEEVVRRYAEVAALRRGDERKLCVLQHRMCVLQDERLQLQDERRSGVAARRELESLCRELQGHYGVLREETLQRCKEDEEKRTDITSHFQMMLTDIQAQIEQHSTRNDRLCHENSSLTDKLEGLMSQCETREESLEKINKQRELQQQLTEARLLQARALLSDAEEKHKREKEYLLVQAAEWKLQAQSLREQGTGMQEQLSLYAQKFDEFQATLAKSNEIYVRFKKEMDNMSEKMKKMEKESTLWRTRFENCNKALTDMMEERTEKSKEYDMFVLKIQKLEKLCQALQSERVILYDKIKEIRLANSNIPSKVFGSSKADETPNPEGAASLTPLQEIQKEDPVLTEGMSRLREEQAKLLEIASSLMATPSDTHNDDSDDVDPEEDLVSSAFVQFKSKAPVKEEPESDNLEEDPKPVEVTLEMIPADAVKVPTQIQEEEVPPVKPHEEIQQQPAEPDPPTAKKPKAAEAEISVKVGEVKPVVPVEDGKVQAEPARGPEEAPIKSESAPPAANTPETSASSNAESSKKQAPKKKKKRNGKSAS